jgi:pimeloyl-ACP methyl ester carboxylesterase
MAHRLRRTMLYLLILIPIGYLGIGIYLYFCQDSLIFFPSRIPTSQMLPQAEAEGFEPWLNADGECIGWQSKEGSPEDVLLVFHGNGGVALDGRWYRERARSAGNWKTFLMEYPGYGNRDGIPSEKSFTEAGVEALDLLAQMPGRRIWMLGGSLGSGTASATVARRPDKVAGLLLVTPFNSLVATAAHHYPWFQISLFLRTRFDSEKNLSGYSGPVAFLVSANDTTVPATLGRKLYDGYAGRKRLWIDPEGDHDVSGLENARWPEIVAWLQTGAH